MKSLVTPAQRKTRWILNCHQIDFQMVTGLVTPRQQKTCWISHLSPMSPTFGEKFSQKIFVNPVALVDGKNLLGSLDRFCGDFGDTRSFQNVFRWLVVTKPVTTVFFSGDKGDAHRRATVARADALRRQTEREERGAARRAAKGAAAAPPPPPQSPPSAPRERSRGAPPRRQNPATVEVVARRPHVSGGAP
jgi:hypothetical protein